ncbi:hypothetical protein TARUN_5804 [Trichoderma arundinaceum]|uniref:Uncharacterized protein n=1 Tax=Trichoderma arundinaceum TaxID=490622 RepID=A0A395NK77_TRIAR|nr:hypothetical protein TARUN_5804 [Trichoderma arundinaceum]
MLEPELLSQPPAWPYAFSSATSRILEITPSMREPATGLVLYERKSTDHGHELFHFFPLHSRSRTVGFPLLDHRWNTSPKIAAHSKRWMTEGDAEVGGQGPAIQRTGGP